MSKLRHWSKNLNQKGNSMPNKLNSQGFNNDSDNYNDIGSSRASNSNNNSYASLLFGRSQFLSFLLSRDNYWRIQSDSTDRSNQIGFDLNEWNQTVLRPDFSEPLLGEEALIRKCWYWRPSRSFLHCIIVWINLVAIFQQTSIQLLVYWAL